jgi:type II secretory ATPase GspE/PulE/Tfp pilus assembly ATPase PilB-like protein
MLGEIRDAETASLAMQAALSGHRLICTLHASSPGGAIARLLEMGLEPYRITSALNGVVAQRLLRRLGKDEGDLKSEISNSSFIPEGSGSRMLDPHPSSLTYKGRVPAAEFVPMTGSLRAAILERADAEQLQQIAARETNYSSLRDSAHSLVARHFTDLAEVERVLGEA